MDLLPKKCVSFVIEYMYQMTHIIAVLILSSFLFYEVFISRITVPYF